ncbi:copper amine oxidase N-terminal domain-containing protein [Paenibacillus periandrae]|uniref:copper amine oxidase N-terminal domain-containing protein n=1 Tax=Paenibacillus periandrae TaxID=1761741 RepID=UPI001F09F405|nr:copper amine oxidase N-terminal domain-containing protein [Paenibacillus periandrae]
MSLLIMLSIWFSLIPTSSIYAGQPLIRVIYEGMEIPFEVAPVLESGSVLVPFRSVFEAFGLTVTWEQTSRRVVGSNDAVKIEMYIGKKNVSVNNEKKDLEMEPRIIDGITMIPLRFVSESMGKNVSWDPSTDTVTIKNRMTVQPTVSNYGNDSYFPTNYSNILGKVNPYVYEKDGFAYFMWSDEAKGGPFMNFYCSVIDMSSGKWLYQNHLFKYVKKEASPFQFLFNENSVYWRTQDGVMKSSFDKGTVTQEVYVVKKMTSKERELMNIARYDDGSVGILSGIKNSMTLYTEAAPNGLLDIKDLNNILMENGTVNTQYLINRSSKLVQIISKNTVKQLNYETGEVSFDEKGKDKIERLKGTSYTQPFFYQNRLYYLYQDGQDRRIKLGSIDDELRNEELGVINFIPPANLTDYKITINEKEIHLWRNTEFNRKPAMEFTNIVR